MLGNPSIFGSFIVNIMLLKDDKSTINLQKYFNELILYIVFALRPFCLRSLLSISNTLMY